MSWMRTTTYAFVAFPIHDKLTGVAFLECENRGDRDEPRLYSQRDEMVIIRDIVNEFSDDEDIELCCDDEEDLELDSSELANITYGTPSSFFVTIDSDAGQDIQNRKNNLSNDFDNELFIGMQFESKDATINAIKQFHIKNSVDYIVVESRPDRYVRQCKYFGSGCQWRIRASLNGKRDLWEIRKINGTHTCVSTNISQDHTKLNSSFIANCIIHLVSEDPDIPVKALVKEIVTRFGYTVTYSKAWTAKQIAMSQIYGDWEGSYKELPRWFNTVQCYAAGTIVRYASSRHDESSSLILDRVFWAFKPCIEGFGFCKPILQVDGTFLTGKYNGTLLIASSQDDRGTGLLGALRTELSQWCNAYSVYCIRHVASNFNKEFKDGDLKEKVIQIRYELMRPRFERMLDDLRQKNPRAAAWLDNIPKEKWTQSYDEGRRYGHMKTNLAECVNGVLKGSRALPITSLIQATYHILNSWFLHHRNEATSMIMAGHIYCEELTKVLNENNRKATCQTIRTFSRESGVFVVEVPDREGSRHSKRPKTHTFHLPIGECTVTLEDVAYQLGLPIDGNIVTRPTNMDWNVVCHNLLGAVPNERQIVGQHIQMSWLDSTFQQLPDDATETVIDQHARAFILRMIGGFLMPDTSGSRVHLMYLLLLEDLSETYQYSWGSAVLACLYRGLCRAALISRQIEIGGCLLLLQSWAWSQHLITTNISGHATNIIRSMLDRLRIDQFVWTPYQNIDFMGQIPDMARSRVPLICFAIVEWHAADRVMRQFGLQQPIPQDPINLQKQHKMDLRGKNDYNWQQKHDQWIQIWNHREDYVMNDLPNVQPLYHYSEYMQWYRLCHFGALSDYSISHQFGSSSHYEESLPTMFGMTSTTPLSAFNSEQYYQPTMPTQVDDEDDEEEEEEVPQLVRGGTRQPTQPSLRVQPPRRKRPPPCGTSSHRRH
ncbi:hypothetical protein Lal_00019312 [Lupinus albus]|nr:hypothetical protein Lal_00019312 [Lupinus albus]